MHGIDEGGFVRYLPKNEIGLVGKMSECGTKAYCWFHTGGTRALTPFDILEPISNDEALCHRFNNEYAKASLFERQARLSEGGDVTDLIDRDGIRESIYSVFEARGEI